MFRLMAQLSANQKPGRGGLTNERAGPGQAGVRSNCPRVSPRILLFSPRGGIKITSEIWTDNILWILVLPLPLLLNIESSFYKELFFLYFFVGVSNQNSNAFREKLVLRSECSVALLYIFTSSLGPALSWKVTVICPKSWHQNQIPSLKLSIFTFFLLGI